MHHIPGKDRNEPLSGSLEELVAPQSFVRIIDAFVDAIDLESFEFSYFQLNEEGRPPFHPAIRNGKTGGGEYIGEQHQGIGRQGLS